MNLGRLRRFPFRLRHQTRVVAVRCRQCDQWRKPRHIRVPAMICRDCEMSPTFQNHKPTTATKPRRQPASRGAR